MWLPADDARRLIHISCARPSRSAPIGNSRLGQSQPQLVKKIHISCITKPLALPRRYLRGERCSKIYQAVIRVFLRTVNHALWPLQIIQRSSWSLFIVAQDSARTSWGYNHSKALCWVGQASVPTHGHPRYLMGIPPVYDVLEGRTKMMKSLFGSRLRRPFITGRWAQT